MRGMGHFPMSEDPLGFLGPRPVLTNILVDRIAYRDRNDG
jgi:hypothetical protein